jgi:protein O-GlcNAc transferase
MTPPNQNPTKHGEATLTLSEVLTRAIAFHRADNWLEAKRLSEAILSAKANQFDALHYFGVLEAQRGRYEEADRLISQALTINPQSAEGHLNHGNVLKALNQLAEALASYDRAVALRPDYAEAFNNRGTALHDLKRHEEALASYEKALALKLDYAEALINRGNALQDLERHEEALASYDRVLALYPDHVEALNNRGNALIDLKRHEEAVASYDRALSINPDHAEALANRGNALTDLKRHEEAIKDFRRVLTLKPDYEYAIGALLYSKVQCCDWREHAQESGHVAAEVRASRRSIIPFAFLAVSDSAQDQLLCSQVWVRDKCPASPSPVWKGERYRHDRIRVSYVSADFCNHATAFLMAELFERHDRARFETTGISFGADDRSAMRSRLKQAFERFIDVRQESDREVANLLRELEIDVAVDLKGFTLDARTGIFALRPAPIQVNYLGYPGTMGADYIDYILADPVVIPKEHQSCYTEKIVYLPDTYQVNDSGRRVTQCTPTRAEAGLPENGFVFCSFNQSYKITATVFDIWVHLLRRVEGSVLWLLGDNAAVMRNLQREASERGISPERLVFAPRAKMEDHLARHRLADLFLDTLPYNAHTTASDALWAGLPVLTCMGASFAGRVGASLLGAIGLPELITHSLAEYEALALKLATESGMLVDIKAKLARNRESFPLFDIDRFRRHIEAAYMTMWERYQRGESPASFEVERLVQPVV